MKVNATGVQFLDSQHYRQPTQQNVLFYKGMWFPEAAVIQIGVKSEFWRDYFQLRMKTHLVH